MPELISPTAEIKPSKKSLLRKLLGEAAYRHYLKARQEESSVPFLSSLGKALNSPEMDALGMANVILPIQRMGKLLPSYIKKVPFDSPSFYEDVTPSIASPILSMDDVKGIRGFIDPEERLVYISKNPKFYHSHIAQDLGYLSPNAAEKAERAGLVYYRGIYPESIDLYPRGINLPNYEILSNESWKQIPKFNNLKELFDKLIGGYTYYSFGASPYGTGKTPKQAWQKLMQEIK